MTIEMFEKDKEKYYVLHQLFLNNHPSIRTDFKTYVLGKENNNKIWIWTKDNMEEHSLKKIHNIIEEELSNYHELSILCKDEVFQYLKNNNMPITESFEMGILICHHINNIEKTSGFMDRPNYGDKLPLARLCIECCKEVLKKEIPMTQALGIVEGWIEDENFYVWKKEDGTAVATAKYEQIKGIDIITQVYTLQEERGHGYCKNLVYDLSKSIQERNYIPVLYTDHLNDISNHIYKKIGYTDLGYVMNIKINKE